MTGPGSDPSSPAPSAHEPAPARDVSAETTVATEPGTGLGADGGAAVAPSAASRRTRAALRGVLDWVVVLSVAAGIALLVRAYVVQTYFIPSSSMYPTLYVGDRILVLKAAYRFTAPAIGDIIVFRAPPAERSQCESPEINDLVKRIVAVPGDTISSKGDVIYVDGHVLHQNWKHVVHLGTPINTQTILPNQYFVMGDNHPESCDSRTWGTVPRSDIIGKAVLIFWPLSRLSIL